MSWQPQQGNLEQVLTLLRQTSSTDTQVQQNLAKALAEYKNNPEFLNYLAHVLIRCPGEDDSHRAVAGLLLKNALVLRNSPPTDEADAQMLVHVKGIILSGLEDKDTMIRQTVAQDITALIGNEEPGGWPEALDALTKGMDSQDINLVEGCFNCLEKICKDVPHKLDFSVQGQNLLDHLVPKFIMYTGHASQKIRLYALMILQSLSVIHVPALSAHIDGYLDALYRRASDESSDVRRSVCMALGVILSSRADKLAPQMDNVINYMIQCTTDKDETVALEACEFWLTFAEDGNLSDTLLKYLPRVAPLLLNGMVYSEMELLLKDNDQEDEAVPDRETDIKPRTYGGKTHGGHEMNDPQSSTATGKSREAAEKALEEEDDDYDDDYDPDEDDDAESEWNVRKCSAAALDVMAVSFGNTLLEVLLPHLKDRLQDAEWVKREAGILALGAIAEGCIDGLQPHLAQIVPWLITSLKDEKALVRSITCWTLGRYSSWVVQVAKTNEQSKQQFFFPTMEGLLQLSLDSNKRVQEAGCSAFATFEEEAGPELVPYLQPILINLTYAFKKYQQKNLLILYDAIGTLADAVGSDLGQPAYLEILMPPLIERWMALEDLDADLVPLLECLSSVSISGGQAFLPYTEPVYQRCLNIIQSSLMQYRLFEQDPEVEEPDRTFIVVALDLLSGLAQGLGELLHPLIAQREPSLLQLMALCMNHTEPPVRQSAFALLGDMAVQCFSLLKPVVPALMPAVIEHIQVEPDAECVSVTNNAAWAMGELALQYQSDPSPLEPFIPGLIQRLVPILLNSKSPKSITENAAVTIGRLGMVCPAMVAPDLATFAQAWCTALWEIKDNDEKDSAFRGFCMMISANPAGIQNAFVYFCNAVCKWQQPSEHLDNMFRQLLRGFRDQSGAAWDQMVGQFPSGIRQRLKERYDV